MRYFKDHFIQLFDYDHHCNLLLLNAINQTGAPLQAVQLMAHLLATQHIWLNRCKGFENPADVTVWPGWKVVTFEPMINQNHDDWTVFLSNLKDEEWMENINYTTTQGVPFTNKLVDIITHVTNHGIHHRAQLGQILKNAGLKAVPPTDYITFIRK